MLKFSLTITAVLVACFCSLCAAPSSMAAATAPAVQKRPSLKKPAAFRKDGARRAASQAAAKRKRTVGDPGAGARVKSTRAKGPVVKMPSATNDHSPNFGDPWPGVVIGPGEDMPFDVVEETEGNYAYETPHFIVTANVDIGRAVMKELARRIETAYEACVALPCNGYARKGDKRVKKYKVHFFDTTENYMKALGETSRPTVAKTRYPEAFLNMSQLALIREGAAYKTDPKRDPLPLVHEMHHLVGKDNSDLGLWYIEGMAEYLGCTPYRDGALYFDENELPLLEYATGHPKRYDGRGIGKKITIPSLEEFHKMTMGEFMTTRVNFHYALATLTVYYWIHLDGNGDAARLKQYVQLLQQRKGRAAGLTALLDGRSWEEVEREYASKLGKLGLEITFAHETAAKK